MPAVFPPRHGPAEPWEAAGLAVAGGAGEDGGPASADVCESPQGWIQVLQPSEGRTV